MWYHGDGGSEGEEGGPAHTTVRDMFQGELVHKARVSWIPSLFNFSLKNVLWRNVCLCDTTVRDVFQGDLVHKVRSVDF